MLRLRFALIVISVLILMNFIIHADHYLGECRLTSEDFHGIRKCAPTLIITDCAYRPDDVIEMDGESVVAARMVIEWATKWERTEAEVDAARRYLSLWPNGPQLEELSTAKRNSYTFRNGRLNSECGLDSYDPRQQLAVVRDPDGNFTKLIGPTKG